MKKVQLKSISMILVFSILLLLLPQIVIAETSGNYTYSVFDGNATITGYSGAGGNVVIPDTLDGNPVTRVGNQAFFNIKSLTGVIIPNSVITIGNSAFLGCGNLISVTIPNSVTSIGSEAFAYCDKLTQINVDVNNSSYSSVDGVFFNKDKTELIQYPTGKTATEYAIPNSVTIIKVASFFSSNLTSITIPNIVTSIEMRAFMFGNLISVTIPGSVTSLGIQAFYYSGLTSVSIPANVANIGERAFDGCSDLSAINVAAGNVNYSSSDGVLYNKSKTSLISYPKGKAGTSFIIPVSVTQIGDTAFTECGSLTRVTLPNGLTSIGNSAFSNCGNLTSITIPNSVTSIGNAAFWGCGSLKSAYYFGNAPTMGADVFKDCDSDFTVYYLEDKIGFSTPTWSGYQTKIFIPVPVLISNFITRFYNLCLSRAPDPEGLSNWMNVLQTGQQTGADVASGFVLSNEFKGLNVSDDVYVTIMYKAFFNRDPDVGGYNGWLTTLSNGMSRYSVLAGFVNSSEFKVLAASFGINPGSLTLSLPADLYPQVTSFVTRFYKLCLGRMSDADGLNSWVNNLKTGKSSGGDVAFGIVFSPEFMNRNVSNSEFVTIMYQAFFARESDPSGYNGWLNVLRTGGSRYHVLVGFANSIEFAKLCKGYGITRGTLK